MEKVLLGHTDHLLGTVSLNPDGSWKLEPRGNHGRELAETVHTLYGYYRRKDRALTAERFLKLLPQRVKGFYTWAAPAWSISQKRHRYSEDDILDPLKA